MDCEFSSKEELYQRVGPALRTKVNELHRMGFTYIQEIDVWNYLIESKWCKSKDLMLFDIVNDILQTENKKFDEYVKMKIGSIERSQYFDSNLEIL